MATAIDKLKIHGVSPVPSTHPSGQRDGSKPIESQRRKEVLTKERIKEEISKFFNDELAKGTYNMQATKAPPVVQRMAYLAKLRSSNTGLTPVDTGGQNGSVNNSFVLQGRQVRSFNETSGDKIDTAANANKTGTAGTVFPKSAKSVELRLRKSSSDKDIDESASVSSLPILNINTAPGYSRSLQSWSPHSSTFKEPRAQVGELEILPAPLLPDCNPAAENVFDFYNTPEISNWESPDFTLRNKPKRKYKHKTTSESSDRPPCDLETCLNIQQSHRSPTKSDEGAARLKHNTQYMLRPHSQTSLTNVISPRRETPELKPTNYYFGSVESYLHFRSRHNGGQRKVDNDTSIINPSVISRSDVRNKHYSDTGSLRVVSDTNKPKSVGKASASHSDVLSASKGVSRQRHQSSTSQRLDDVLDDLDYTEEEPWPGMKY